MEGVTIVVPDDAHLSEETMMHSQASRDNSGNHVTKQRISRDGTLGGSCDYELGRTGSRDSAGHGSSNTYPAFCGEADEKTPLMSNSRRQSTKGSLITRKILLTRFTAIAVCTAVCITAVCTNILLPVTYDFTVGEYNNSTNTTATP